MELRHVDSFRRLSIKINNAVKFFCTARVAVEQATGAPIAIKPLDGALESDTVAPHDWYMLHRLHGLITVCSQAFEERALYKATEAIRAFVFNDFCDIFLEFQKNELTIDTNVNVCSQTPPPPGTRKLLIC